MLIATMTIIQKCGFLSVCSNCPNDFVIVEGLRQAVIF